MLSGGGVQNENEPSALGSGLAGTAAQLNGSEHRSHDHLQTTCSMCAIHNQAHMASRHCPQRQGNGYRIVIQDEMMSDICLACKPSETPCR